MIPLFKVRMSPEAKRMVGETLASGYIGQGPKYDELESKLAGELGKKPILTNSCTSALSLALRLAGVGPGDKVISSPQTCLATNSVIALESRSDILWSDIDPRTGNIDPYSVARILKNNKDVKAIVAVNWAGRLCDYKALKAFGIPVIEDAAHNMVNSPWGDHSGDYTCYSLQAIKFWTSGDGGILFTPEDKFDLGYRLNWYGLDRRTGASFRCSQDVLELGYKYHMNDIAATIALANYDLAKQSLKEHRSNAYEMLEEFKVLDTISTPDWSIECDYWLMSILVEKGTKEDFIEHMGSKGISCNPIHRRNDTFSCLSKYQTQGLKGVDEFSRKQVSIPVGWWLSPEDKERIIEAVKSYGH